MKVGIIGGNGVAATNKLLELTENYYTKNGAFRDEHHPEMIVYQATKVPSRSMFLEGRGKNFIPEYIDIAKKLEYIGADVLCMCCNTAHYAIDEISENINVAFIDLIKEVVNTVKNTNKKNVGLIASDGCLKAKIYEKYFSKLYNSVNIIYPNEIMQKNVTQGICNIKNNARFLDNTNEYKPSNIFNLVVNELLSDGADIIITGCTDIRVDFIPNDYIIDSLEVLAKSIVQYDRLS